MAIETTSPAALDGSTQRCSDESPQGASAKLLAPDLHVG
jgi:hypothetical protein